MSTRSPRGSFDPGTVVTDLADSIPASLRPLLGAVLAGGQSRRFGRDKIAVEVEGVPMVLRAVRALEALCDDVVLVAPGSDVLSVLEASLRGRRLTDHFALAYAPGEVRYVGDMGDARPWAPRRPS